MTPLQCPACPAPLKKTSRHDVPVWACGECAGCAVEMAALRERVDRSQLDLLLLRANSPGAAWARPCPRCEKRGREARVRDAQTLYVLDWCAGCELLWFDVSELQGLVPAPAEPEPEPEPPAAQRPGPASGDREAPPRSRRAQKPDRGASERGRSDRGKSDRERTRRKSGRSPGKPGRARSAKRRRPAPRASSADIVAELAGDVGVEALLALLASIAD